ncbi:hypothetical protein SprV_0200897400 [Sparganum proliferum]
MGRDGVLRRFAEGGRCRCSRHPLPGSAVCPDASVKITKDNQPTHLRHSSKEGLEIFVELGIRLVGPSRWQDIDTDDSSTFGSLERRAQAYEAVVDILRQIRQSSCDVSPDGKGDACISSLCLRAATPEEGVAGTHLHQLVLIGEAGLVEGSDVHHVARRPPFRLVAPRIV